MQNLFIIVLRYLAPAEQMDAYREAHYQFLDANYAKGHFIASGKQTPATGGIIIARGNSRVFLRDLLAQDPFAMHNLAEYQIFEFHPTRHLPEIKALLAK